jgi:hypothetical protein
MVPYPPFPLPLELLHAAEDARDAILGFAETPLVEF